jgi:hypothetical protein
MAYGTKVCSCCGSTEGVERHHLYPAMDGCPDDLTVWLCHTCHGRVHGQMGRMNLSDMAKAVWLRPHFRERLIRTLRAKKAWRTRRVSEARSDEP